RPLYASVLSPENSQFNFALDNCGSLTISPDGRWLTFPARDQSGKTVLWLRALDSTYARVLVSTDAFYPFWSPDSKFVGFFSDGKLQKINIGGGPPVTICDAPNGRGGTWNQNGLILFAPNTTDPIYQVSASGGKPAAVTKLNEQRQETTHRYPEFLPDGKHFLFLAGSHSTGTKSESNVIYAASLDGKVNKLLLQARSNAVYASGHLLFLREGVLMAQGFDAKTLEAKGDPQPVAERVEYSTGFFRALFAVNPDGYLAYKTGTTTEVMQLVWVDRNGKQMATVGDKGVFGEIRISPDGKKALMTVLDPDAGTPDIWIMDLARGVRTRLTFDPSAEFEPIWSPDSTQVVFSATRGKFDNLYLKSSSGMGAEQLLVDTPLDKAVTDWSRDGRFILYEQAEAGKNKGNIWVLPMSGDRKPYPLLQTPFDEGGASFSPDGKWIAYTSDESGRRELYVMPFDKSAGGKWQVSTSGAAGGGWSSDREITYLSVDGSLMAVPVRAGNAFESDAPVLLFKADQYGCGDGAANGQRFLVCLREQAEQNLPIAIISNWTSTLKK
ncbi:MAG TPA: hypothetical protein VJ521_14365, partial [Acidobacteriota bacterium]|nr:hypothetical protein [Acidobacteriota bacterium]